MGVDVTIQKYMAKWSTSTHGGWIAQIVKLQVSISHEVLALKYLGIHNIQNNTMTTQLCILGKDPQRDSLRIALRTASVTRKPMVYIMYAVARTR